MAAKKKMSVADILAAARKSDAGESGDKTDDAAAASGPAADAAPKESPAEDSPKPATKASSGDRPSVSDILAAARAKGGGAPASKPAAKAAPAAKPAAKKPAEKKEAAKPAAAGGAMSTSSILDAARGGAKRGPVSKEAVVAKAKPDAPAKPAGKQKIAVPPMPEKPGYAKPAAAKKTSKPDRRGFLSVMGLMVGTGLGVGFTSLTMTLVVWTLGLARFMFPNVRIEPPSKFKVGFPTDIAPGIVETKYKAQYGVWIVNAPYNGQQEIFALSTVCTHLGCTPNWLEAEQKFKCPCHGSGFYIDGINFEGPAPRPLERYSISIAGDGQLEVDKSLMFQQEKGEWENPGSFVPV